MKREFTQHLEQNLPFLKDKKLLVAISGGIDSVVLTYLLKNLNFNITLAHCNFLLRGKESDKDESFVLEFASKLGITAYSKSFETEKYAANKNISIQMAARELRYNWFEELLQKNQLDYIITAHQKDDELETFLINFTRGTGLNGLTGIPVINGNIIRPFLPFSRNDILIYATKNKLNWREDSSNQSIKYIRNKIRHKVIPILKELNPNLLDSFSKTMQNLTGSKQIVADYLKLIKEKVVFEIGDEIYFKIDELNKLSQPKAYLFELLKTYNFTEWDDLHNLLHAQTGKFVVSKTHRLLKNRDQLILTSLNVANQPQCCTISKTTQAIQNPISLQFEIIEIPFDTKNDKTKILQELINNNNTTMVFDFNLLQFPLTLRKWQKGDYFYPIGLNGKKKISKYFKDQKLSMLEKENAWLLCSGNNIIWLVGKRMDDRFKVTPKTSTIFKITHN